MLDYEVSVFSRKTHTETFNKGRGTVYPTKLYQSQEEFTFNGRQMICLWEYGWCGRAEAGQCLVLVSNYSVG